MAAALALGALAAGGSLLSGLGAKQAAAKTARMQSMENDRANIANATTLNAINDARLRLGHELLDVPEIRSHSEHSSTTNRSWVDTDAMMAAAERSGFNPVTWLNAGGMQAYTQSSQWSESSTYDELRGHNAADAYKLMIPEYALQQAAQVPAQQSALSAFGGALSAGASAFGTQYRADQSLDLQGQRLAAMALGGMNQGMGLSQNNGLMTALVGSGGARGGTNLSSGVSPTSKDNDVYWPGMEQAVAQLWENKKPEATNPFPPSWGWTIPAGYANAETWEDAFGEPVSWPYGALKFGHTVVSNLDKALDTTPTQGWFQRPVMQTIFGNPNVYSAPWMRSGSAAP